MLPSIRLLMLASGPAASMVVHAPHAAATTVIVTSLSVRFNVVRCLWLKLEVCPTPLHGHAVLCCTAQDCHLAAAFVRAVAHNYP